jgi:hypothetical protein
MLLKSNYFQIVQTTVLLIVLSSCGSVEPQMTDAERKRAQVWNDCVRQQMEAFNRVGERMDRNWVDTVCEQAVRTAEVESNSNSQNRAASTLATTEPPKTVTSVIKPRAGEQLVGRWYDKEGNYYVMIVRRGDVYHGEVWFGLDATDRPTPEHLRLIGPVKGGRFVILDNDHGEYYVIDARGNLGEYDREGYIRTAGKE